MPPTKEKRRSKYDTSEVQPAKRAKPAATTRESEPASEHSQPELEDEHAEPAAESIEEAPIHTMSSDELSAHEDAAEPSAEAGILDDGQDDAMVAALTQAEAAHASPQASVGAQASRSGSVNGDKVIDPNDTLLGADKKLNLVHPRWVEPDGKFNIYVKVNKFGDRKYLNVNSGKGMKQALAKFGDLPPNSYGVKILPPFSVITADPLVS